MNKKKYLALKNELTEQAVDLIVVSKKRSIQEIQQLYDWGQRRFGENRPKELKEKAEALPQDIEWHMIGNLQRKSVKYIIPHVQLIHSVDSVSLLEEINKRAIQNSRTVDVLLQVHIAQEQAKSGFSPEEFIERCKEIQERDFSNISVLGVMGMATFTKDGKLIQQEFTGLKELFDRTKQYFPASHTKLLAGEETEIFAYQNISMGMSGDYKIAIDCGSTMVRIGSLIFNT